MTDTHTPPGAYIPRASLQPDFYAAWKDGVRPALVEYAPQWPNPWRSAGDDPIDDPRDWGYVLTQLRRP